MQQEILKDGVKIAPTPKLDSFSSAIQRLAEALETKPIDTLARDAAIQPVARAHTWQ